jgi:alpha-D-xyloside xylohydrolase
MLTSHSRTHGAPPREPWEYGKAFEDDFRKAAELKYRLMPYVYAQAKDSSERGLPMMRALFIEYPEDPGAWTVDDAYLFGSSILVAPLLEAGTTGRDVYLPGGRWIDYQSGRVYERGWQRIEAGEIPVIMLVRDGTVLPYIALAQSTAQMDWTKIELVAFAADKDTKTASGLVCLPADNALTTLTLERSPAVAGPGTAKAESGAATAVSAFALRADPFGGRVKWSVRLAEVAK